jgi:hypothetical protein
MPNLAKISRINLWRIKLCLLISTFSGTWFLMKDKTPRHIGHRGLNSGFLKDGFQHRVERIPIRSLSALHPAFPGTWFLTIKPEVRSTKHEAGLNPAFSGTWFLTKEFPHFTSILIILFIFEF